MSNLRMLLPPWRRWARLATWLSLLLILLLAIPEDLWARRGGRISSPSRGGGFSSRSYKPTPSRAKTWGGSAPASIRPRMGTRTASRPATATTPRRSTVDQATLNRARTQGTIFNSRADAERAFERDYANRFPSSFSREPAQRPSHIPPTTTVDGRSYDVAYNPQRGGYGFMRDGSWVAYNVFRDVAFLSLLMRQNGYVHAQSPRDADRRAGENEQSGDILGSQQPEEKDEGGSWFGGGTGLAILLLVIGIAAMMPRNRGGYRPVHGTPSGRGPVIATMPGRTPTENRVSNELNPYSVHFWRALKPGSTIILKDEQTLQDMIESGETLAAGRDYQVEEAWRVRERQDVAEWQFFRIRSPHDEDATWLLVKSAGDALSAGVYFEADGFQPGSRRDILDQNNFWVFNEPRDPDNYRVQELQFASHLYFNVDLNGEVREVEFAKMGNLEFHGSATADPPVPGNDRMVGTVAEYETMLPVPNPKVAFLETGIPGSNDGLVRMLQGADIRMSDLEVLPVRGVS